MSDIQAMLLDLEIKGLWSAEQTDKSITAEVAQRHQLTGSPGKYVKALFPVSTCGKPNPHTRWSTACYEVRKYWKNHTTPWEDGRRIVAEHYVEKFCSGFNAIIEEANAAFARFVDWLPEGMEKANTPEGLNGLFNHGDYPTEHQLKQRFSITYRILPLPSSDHLVARVVGGAVDSARQILALENEARIERARQFIWMEVLEPVEHMADMLAKPGEPKFWDSLVTNVKSVAERIPAMDFDRNPQLAAIRDRLLNLTATLDPDQLRNDPLLRQQVGSTAAQIAATFGSFKRKLSV